jgi:hypothetical protein
VPGLGRFSFGLQVDQQVLGKREVVNAPGDLVGVHSCAVHARRRRERRRRCCVVCDEICATLYPQT